MYSLSTSVWKMAQRTYHKVMHAYNSILYRDCLDLELKEVLFEKVQHHKQKMVESA
ncbi:hypothetical protein J2Z65_006336 [Paenibacillus aceris]|uniref:Uncharacterized protein n=1 Tax=Paenibacillus aceris TaxID=869555 RepID=A0ABS4I808_9BACL|nr:hypothetical protein [Paenibacillus aceris]